jgi:ribonuclease P protein component
MSAPSGEPRPTNSPAADSGPAPASRSARPFPKSSRILSRGDFRRVYDQGFRYSSRLFAAFCLDRSSPAVNDQRARPPGARIGFTVPRAVGKAVQRNRIKRRMREALRYHLPLIGPQWDVVVNPRRAVLDAPFAEVRNEVRKLVNRCKP